MQNNTYNIITKIFLMVVLMASLSSAKSWVRYNQAGYTPNRDISVIVMSDVDLKDQAWILKDDQDAQVKTGVFFASEEGAGDHTSKDFNYTVSIGTLSAGKYTLVTPGSEDLEIKVEADPYSKLITQALRHLRVERSGTSETLLRSVSHLGDSAAILYQVDGDAANGAWIKANPERKVDLLGGWYDAGDYIKFTLTIAHTAYGLLRAYEENPKVFTKVYSQSKFNDVLDEAKFGLDYLAKTLVDDDTFIIQVSTGLDHHEGKRLPESDARDGKREALAAISRPHMGSTSAALALGARIFKDLGEIAIAANYETIAKAIYARAQQGDALNSGAFERDNTNDFYHDKSDTDNMKLAAAELYKLTNDPAYQTDAAALVCGAGSEASWATWNFLANWAFNDDVDALAAAQSEVNNYVNVGKNNLWNLPSVYTWASLHRWIGAANSSRLNFQKSSDAEQLKLFEDILDYTFGRNNWGVSFMASPDLENGVENIYSQIYTLLDVLGKGAVSEGPADRTIHESMESYFTISPDDPMHEFSTPAAVFFDSKVDFVTQESTTIGQSEAILMLALASSKTNQVLPDTGAVDIPKNQVDISERFPQDLGSMLIYGYTDKGEGGDSQFDNFSKSSDSVTITLHSISGPDLDYQYAGLGMEFSDKTTDMQQVDGVVLQMNIEVGKTVRVNFPQSNINDHNYYGKTIVGKGAGEYIFVWSEMETAWASASPIVFDPAKVVAMDIISLAPDQSVSIKVTKLELWRDSVENVTRIRKQSSLNPANGMILEYLNEGNSLRLVLDNPVGADVKMRKLSGDLVHSLSLSERQTDATIDTSSYANGVYIIDVRDYNNRYETLKYVKTN